MSLEGIIDRSGLHRKLEEIVKCFDCSTVIKSPAIVCTIGHAVCVNCGQYKTNCKLCNNRLVSRRHNLLNNILTALSERVDYLEKIVEHFQCPVCYKQIYNNCELCEQGHAVCRNCSILTLHCPLCRSNYACAFNSVVNQIIKELQRKISCIHSDRGCKESHRYFELMGHEIVCDYREFNCIVKSCEWFGRANQTGKHCEEKHKRIILTNGEVTLFRGKKLLHMLQDDRRTFWILYTFNSSGVYLTCHEHVTKTKGYLIQLILPAGNKFTHEVYNIRESGTECLKRHKCIFIPKETLENLGINDKFKCHLTVIKKSNAFQNSSLLGNKLFSWLLMFNIFLFGYYNITK